MFSRYQRLAAAILCAVMIIPILSGCSVLFGDGDPTDEVFKAPYIDNYYVNRHEAVCVSGDLTIYKYDSTDAAVITMGGHDYHGGFVIGNGWSSAELGCVELPLDGLYENISFVIGGSYSIKQVTIGEDGKETYQSNHPYVGSYPTLRGQKEEARAGVQFLIDGVIADEVLISSYDVERRYTFDISGAETFTFKVMADSGLDGIPVMELTVWEGEARETGYVSSPADDKAVKLIRDLRPYLIPAESNSVYYPSYTAGDRAVFMANTEYTDVLTSQVSSALLDAGKEEIYFNLEGKYNYLTFTAGAADSPGSTYEGSAWLTVYADGKNIFEEMFSFGELQRTFTLGINGCRRLKFSWSANPAGEIFGDTKAGVYAIADAYVAISEEALAAVQLSEGDFPERPVKIISELGVFSIRSETEDAVFDGSDEKNTFSMAGREYTEGILLLSSNSLLLGNEPATAAFNLGGKYDTVSFIAGHIDNRKIYKNEKLQIYADGTLIKEIDIRCTALPERHTVNVSGCRHLEFVSGLEHATSLQRPVLGVANLIAYPCGVTETELFEKKEEKDYPSNADLIEVFGFYDVRNPISDIRIGGVSNKDGYFDGSGKSSFKLGSKYYSRGLILHTNTDPSPDMDRIIGAGLMGAPVAAPGLSVVSLSSSGEAHESAFAIANISGGDYSTLTFTVSYLKNKNTADPAGETRLMIIANGKVSKEITLTKSMKPSSYTVDIEGCEQLTFWLDCSSEDSPSHYYAVCDMILSK